MKKALTLFGLLLVILFAIPRQANAQAVWDGTTDVSWYDASQNSFDISTPEQLAGFAQLVNNGTSNFNGKVVNLLADVWLNSTGDSTNNWTMIGGSPTASGETMGTEKYFEGTFHGHGHKIYNMFCDHSNYFQGGLFGAVKIPGIVDSLVLINPVVKARGMAGSFIGFMDDGNSGAAYLKYCLAINTRIEGGNGNNVGGLVGATWPSNSNVYIENCGVTGHIKGNYVGGLGGNAQRANYTNCYFAGTLNHTNSNYGSLCGYSGTVTNCYANINESSNSDARTGTVVTDAYMQSQDIIDDLGSAFKMDCALNNGYPILSFINCGVPVEGSLDICYGESTTLTAYGYDSYEWSTGDYTATVTLSPTTTTDYYVTGYSSDGTVIYDTITVTVHPQADITVTAMPSSDNQVHGTVTPTTTTVPCGSTQTVNITITPDANWHISKIVLNGTVVRTDDPTDGPVVTYTIDPQGTLADVKVYFDNRYDITVAQYLTDGSAISLPALVSPWGDNGVFHSIQGDSAHYNFYGNDRYHITDVMIDGASYGVINQYTFYTIDQTHSIDIYYADSCGIFTIPTTEDFEIFTSMPECWGGNSTYSSAYPQLSPNTGASGLRSVYLYSYSGYYTMLTTPAIIDTIAYPISSLQVNFNMRSSTTDGTLTVGVLTDPNDPNSFHPTQSFSISSANTWINKTAFFPGYANGGNNIAFKWTGNGGLYIDDVTFDFAPDCAHPEDLVIDQITGASARISWTPGLIGTVSDYTIEYSEAGQENWTTLSGISTTSYLLGGLQPATDYDIRVMSNCDDATSSEWLTGDFRTGCLAGGNVNIGDGTSTTGYLPAYNYYNYAIGEQLFTASELGGANTFSSIAFNCSSANATSRNWDIYLMPTTLTSLSGFVNIDSTAVKVFSGNAAISTGWFTINFDTAFVYDGSSNLLLIVDDNTGSYVTGNSYYYHSNPNGNSYYQYNDNTNYDPTNLSGGSSTSYRNNVIFGGECDNNVTCIAPNMNITNITNSSADIVWVAGYQETSWELEYKISSDTDWTSMGSVSSMNETISNLDANTSYDVRLRSNCGTDYSDWVTGTFRTECGAIISLPYFEDFETGVYQTSQDKYITCWERYTSNSSHFVYIGVGSSNAYSGNNYLDFHYTPDCFDIAIMPELDASYDITTLMANFWLKQTNNLSAVMEVGVMTDRNDYTTFEAVDTIIMPSYGSYSEITVGFSNYAGNGHYIAFRVHDGNGGGFLLDDLTIDIAPFCSPVSSLSVSDETGSSAQIQWNAGVLGTTTEYTLEYSEAGMDSWTTIPNITTTSYLLGGLEPSTYYDVRVMSFCDDGSNGDWVTETFRTACLAGGDVTIGDGTITSSNFPAYNYYNYAIGQQLFTAAELGGSNVFHSISFNCSNAYATSRNWDIYLMPTTASSFSGLTSINSSAVKVFSGNVAINTGWFTINFDSTFVYDGTSNLLLIVDDNTGSYTSSNSYYCHNTTSGSSYYYYSDNTNYDPTNVSGGYSSNYRNNIILGGECDTTVTCIAPTISVSNITEDAAEIIWVPGYQETSWELEYKRDEDNIWTTVGTVTSMDENLTNLAANTLYNVRMRSDCGAGEYSIWKEISFRTDCGAISQIPYTENFNDVVSINGTNYLNCWDRYASNSEHYVYMYSGVAVPTGTYCLDFHYTPSCFNIAIMPPVDDNINVSDLMASFYVQRTGTSSVFEVGVMTSKTDPTSFVAIDTIAAPNVNEWLYVNIPLTDYTGNGKYIAFRVSNGQSCGFRMDDITVDYTPTCWKPTNVASSNITTTSADITWSQEGTPSSWNIEYGPEGFTPGTGTTLTGVTSPATISGLTNATTYDVYVQADCGNGDLSQWSNVHTFNTVLCEATDQCEFTITMHDSYGDGWNGNSIEIYSNDIFVTSVTLSSSSTGSIGVPLCNGSVTTFRWHIGNYADETSFEITDPFGTQIYACTDGSSLGGNLTFFTDTIDCTPPACPTPTHLTVDNITTTSVDLSWTQLGTPTQWNIEYGPAGFAQGTGTIVSAGSNPYTLTNLTPATNYAAYVQADCGDEVSNWSTVITFSTACDIIALPYSETFESYAGTEYDLSGPVPNCWATTTTNTTYPAPHVTSSGSYHYPYSGNNCLVFTCGSAGADAYAILPEFDQPLNTLHLNFFRRMENTSSGTLTVGYVTSSTNTASFVSVATIPSIGSPGDTISVDFTDANIPANGLIAFHWNYSTSYYSCCIDDINVTLAGTPGPQEPCDVPTDLVASNVSQTSAVISWTAGGTETAWNLEYKTAAGLNWNPSISVTGNPTYTLDNLTANTQYFVRVQAVCGTGNASDWSLPIPFQTLEEGVETCDAPTNLHQTDIQNHEISIAWDQASTDVDNWTVNFRKQGTTNWTSFTATATQYTITGLEGLTSYEIEVLANCSNGLTSDPSNRITVETTNVGIEDFDLNSSVSLFPNPTNDLVKVECSETMMESISLYDVYGKLINQFNVNDTYTTLDVTKFANGIYFVRITTENGVVTKRLVKE